jgi:hypothetical protein
MIEMMQKRMFATGMHNSSIAFSIARILPMVSKWAWTLMNLFLG